MAQMVRLVDDVDKSSDADRTISFAFAGKEYEIDLAEPNADQFTAEITFWIEHARKRGTVPKVLAARKACEPKVYEDDMDADDEWWRTNPDDSPAVKEQKHKMRQAIREWGIRNGFPSLGERGKLPRALYNKWRKVHQTQDRHRKPEPDDDTEESEQDSDPGQAELDVTPSFSDGHHKPRKVAKKAPVSRTRTSVRVAS